MKHTIILSAFVVILVTATFGSAQISSLRVTFSESINNATGGGQGMGKVVVQDSIFNPDLKIFEALVPASTVEQCFAATDFSSARLVGPDRATLSYGSGGYEFTVVASITERDECRVFLVGETVAGARYNVWRASFGRTAFSEGGLINDENSEERTVDGSVRFVSYQVGVSAWY